MVSAAVGAAMAVPTGLGPASTDMDICAVHPWEMFCVFPQLSPFYTHFEKTFSGDAAADWFLDHLEVPFAFVCMYLAALYFGQKYMADKAPFKLQTTLAAWNLGLSVFSTIAMLRTVPHLLYYVYQRGVDYTICTKADVWFGNGVPSFWVAAFVLSKIPELVDTAFIVVRKRKLIFLHWYHHATVLLVCWYAGATKQSAGLYFISMNFTVHAVMYFYYYLAAIGRRVSWAPLVTAMQISQMFVGAWLCLKIEIAKRSGSECHVTPTCHLTTSLMYLSYLYLFCHFAWFRFGPGRSSKGKSSRSKRITPSPTSNVPTPPGGDKLVRRFKPEGTAACSTGGDGGVVNESTAVAGRDAGEDLEAGVTPSAMHHMMAPEVRKKRAD